MKINYIKKGFSILLVICIVASLFAGCSSEEVAIDFIYPFSANVRSYDPQVASTSDEFLIVENCFEGLVRVDDDGTVKPGVAEKWSVSDNGLIYTFNLKKGIKWNIDTELNSDGERKEDKRLEYMGYKFNPDITANDFVFALRRAAQPETECPLFSSISCIKNATEIHSGKKESSELGVKVISTYALQIELETPDNQFLETLSTAVAMPCNEEFFNATKGRYGLTTEYTLFNGQFYLSQILEASYLLKKNELYTGPSPAIAKELTLKINKDESAKDTIDKLESGYYDAAFISGKQTDSIKKNKGITYTPYTDTTWAFKFNTNVEMFKSKRIRKAFCLGFTKMDNSEKEYLSPATNLTPSSCKIGANNAIEAMKPTVEAQDVNKSVELWKKAIKEYGDTDFTVTILTTTDMEQYAKKLIQGIQGGICGIIKNEDGNSVTCTIKINALDDYDFKVALAQNDYDIALCPYRSTSNSAIAFLDENFKESSEKFDKCILAAEEAHNLTDIAENAANAEKELLSSYTVYPMIYESSYYCAAKGVSGIQFHAGSGRISFTNADRKK